MSFRLQNLCRVVVIALLLAPVGAHAEDGSSEKPADNLGSSKTTPPGGGDSSSSEAPAEDPDAALPEQRPNSLPGSPSPPGLGLSPEAPPVPATQGGRAPSFGAPEFEAPGEFRIGGRFFGWQAFGLGSEPENPPSGGHSGTPLHVPMRSVGRTPFWGGAGATLNLTHTTRYVTAFASYYFRVGREEHAGFSNPQLGPAFGLAYLTVTPDPIGRLRLSFRVGSLTEVYAGPGQWGWGIFGPMLGLRGLGETTNGEFDLSRDLRLTFNHGVLATPGVPENFSRGDFNSWFERGVSSWVHHAHIGAIVKNQYTFGLHYASAYGADERPPEQLTFLDTEPGDGRFDVLVGEARWQSSPWGQLGVSGGVYNFDNAESVGNSIWWAVDWTQGSREMVNKFLGPQSSGNGTVAVVGAEYNFSVATILWAKARETPITFTGKAPDLRVAVAGMLTKTISSDDPSFDGAQGYFVGLDTEYVMTSMFSLTFQAYGESRDTQLGPWSVYSLNPGIALRSDWLSADRIQLLYGRRFYSDVANNNPTQPLDEHMLALGGFITF